MNLDRGIKRFIQNKKLITKKWTSYSRYTEN